MRQTKIIFDLDDTLYVDKELRHQRNNTILKFLGERSLDFIRLKKYYTTLNSLRKLGVSREKFYDLMDDVEINLEEDIKLIKLFESLRGRYQLIVLSNSSKQCVEITLNKLGIFNLIDEIYCGEDFKEPKPFEDCFFMIRQGDFCVGNNFEKDLKIPQERGAITILVGNEDGQANYVINNIYELEEVLNSELNNL